MRFRYQVLMAPLAYAANTQLLPRICATYYDELPVNRCVLLGLLRVFLHGLLLPLACCYAFEAHARRLFLRIRQPAAPRAAPAAPHSWARPAPAAH